jgi:hypothetical protein
MVKSSTDKKLDLLVQAVEKLVATPVAPVLPVAPIAPVAPVLPLNNDDLIIRFTRLDENVTLNFKQVKDAIKELSDGTATRINSLEVKSESNMKDILVLKTQLKVWCIALGLAWGVLEVVLRMFKVL